MCVCVGCVRGCVFLKKCLPSKFHALEAFIRGNRCINGRNLNSFKLINLLVDIVKKTFLATSGICLDMI